METANPDVYRGLSILPVAVHAPVQQHFTFFGEYVGLPSTDLNQLSSGALWEAIGTTSICRFRVVDRRFLADGFIRPSIFFSTRLEETFQAKSWGTGLRWLFLHGGEVCINSSVVVVIRSPPGTPSSPRRRVWPARAHFPVAPGNNILRPMRNTGVRRSESSDSSRVAAFHDMGATFQPRMSEPMHSVGANSSVLSFNQPGCGSTGLWSSGRGARSVFGMA